MAGPCRGRWCGRDRATHLSPRTCAGWSAAWSSRAGPALGVCVHSCAHRAARHGLARGPATRARPTRHRWRWLLTVGALGLVALGSVGFSAVFPRWRVWGGRDGSRPRGPGQLPSARRCPNGRWADLGRGGVLQIEGQVPGWGPDLLVGAGFVLACAVGLRQRSRRCFGAHDVSARRALARQDRPRVGNLTCCGTARPGPAAAWLRPARRHGLRAAPAVEGRLARRSTGRRRGSCPGDAVLWALTSVVPGDLVQKALLLGALVLGGVGAGRLVRHHGFAGPGGRRSCCSVWNPWVLERLQHRAVGLGRRLRGAAVRRARGGHGFATTHGRAGRPSCCGSAFTALWSPAVGADRRADGPVRRRGAAPAAPDARRSSVLRCW